MKNKEQGHTPTQNKKTKPIKTTKTMETNKRVPRPKGLTEIASYQNTNKAVEGKIEEHMIRHYISTGFQYCNENMGIDQFSRLTGIEPSIITEKIIEYGSDTMGMVDPEESGAILRALVGVVLKETLTDRSKALQQHSILFAAQGHSYKPFISGEVTKALKLGQEATSNLMNFYRMMAGNEGTKVLINNTNQVQTQTNYITPDQALELIAQKDTKAPLLENPEQRDVLFLEHNISDTPEVQANKQQGVDLTKEGVNFNKLAKVSEGLVNDMDEPRVNLHKDRRAIELDVDLDIDQF